MADELTKDESPHSAFFKMKLLTGKKTASGEEKVGNDVIEVPDSGPIAPVYRFEQGIASAANMTIDETKAWLEAHLKKTKPIRSEINIVLDITPQQVTNKTFQMNIVWAADRGEWVGISLIEWLDNFKWSNDFHFDGPFELDEKYKRIILEEYGIPEDALGVDGVTTTEPLKLVQIKRDHERNENKEAAEPAVE